MNCAYLLFLGVLLRSSAADVSQVKSKEEWTPGICVREFPEELRKDFRNYLSGYDYENRPVLFWEVGHFEFLRWAEHNETSRKMAYDYFEHIWCKIHNLTSPLPDAEDGVLLVLDSAGFNASQLLSVEVAKMNIHLMRLAEKYNDAVAGTVAINTNFVTDAWINLVRPVAGRLFGNMEVTGLKRERWLPVLRGKMDISAIPPWITGEMSGRNYTPVEIW